ncbi:DUF1217 domain-containing protein [Marivita sp. XM-24bin2]|uniref:DUF1217 domain-containing protein n=1 Tax=unclassified Marivita TaxID=2632480 RepID=UPI0025C5F519|nr:DUF1217 domain-containing protein [Marivita sp. XM-24bin2]
MKATLKLQKVAHSRSVVISSDTQYFLERFPEIRTPDDIVDDRRVLRVILGAYGLSEDIDNRHFIKTLMTEGVADQKTLANKLADRRYKSLARDFDFSISPPSHFRHKDLARKTAERFQDHTFETAIGDTNPEMRLALGFSTGIRTLWKESATNDAAWFQILATPPLKKVLQTALGLPAEFSRLDIDEQHQRIQEKARRVFGTSDISELSSDTKAEDVTRRFLVLDQAKGAGRTSSLHTALVLLSAIPQKPV